MSKASRGRGKGSKGNSGSGPNSKRTRSKDGRIARRITRRFGRRVAKRLENKRISEVRVVNGDRQNIQEGHGEA